MKVPVLTGQVGKDTGGYAKGVVVGSGPVYLLIRDLAGDAGPGYQAVLEVGFSKGGEDLTEAYLTDRRLVGDPVYTLRATGLSWPALLEGTHPADLAVFHGDLARGDRDDELGVFQRGVAVSVKRLIYIKRFAAVPDAAVSPDYLLFGTARELYAVHMLNGREDFDQVALVRLTSGVTTEAQAQAIRRARVARLAPPSVGATPLDVGTSVYGAVKLGGKELPLTIETIALLPPLVRR